MDFTYEIAMPKLHTHFKKLKQDIAHAELELGVAELTVHHHMMLWAARHRIAR